MKWLAAEPARSLPIARQRRVYRQRQEALKNRIKNRVGLIGVELTSALSLLSMILLRPWPGCHLLIRGKTNGGSISSIEAVGMKIGLDMA
jgi:hypothetical protein